ncbi:P-loop containing nucleoside triphosphate hydrolase protein [Armillaria solidipes]|uniref:P-loop containing nucleoside triphosphate hydrolase protein n=1 Tax=Armillaria solidipes TaxID=1076256 RepID=A0A2H3BDI0_9AGAR|nr:P-loop containing nucleoside triphosphate hydrolase protein [Armillaria solidipes]
MPLTRTHIKTEVIVCLGHLLCQVDILEHAKPTQFSNDFTQVSKDSSGQLHDYNYRYNTRLRGSKHLVVVLKTLEGHEFKGSPAKAHGKRASINVSGSFHGTVTGVKVFGRERATNAEKAHDMLLLRALQGECHLSHSKFVRMLWFPSKDDEKYFLISDTQTSPVSGGNLNKSQRKVVSSMISARPLVLVHGPPGTGKTWTISAAAEIWGRSNLTTRIVAHSNIAEKLALSHVDFKIVVSKEFYFEHEHIYTKVKDKLLRVDRLPKNQKNLRRTIGKSSIMLSTLSMLSNPALDQNGMFNLVPPKSLVVDEASQINVFDYMHIFFKFQNEMKQVCFFGDPKQLPPYGQDKAPSIQSIFDIDHLKDMAHMLDVQYRMPHPVGNFIFLEAYNNQLRLENTIMDASCIAFIDAKYGTEKSGFSWRNYEEVRTIAHLVRLYYKDHDFCVITPYDAQRTAIEKELKRQTLPSEQVFNFDSFQGNYQV